MASGPGTTNSECATNARRSWLWILGGIILAGAGCLVWVSSGLSRSSEPTLGIPTYHAGRTQILVSVVFTNTSRRPLVCARNSNVRRLTPDGWTTSIFNNVSEPDPLIVRPGHVGSYQLRLPPDTERFQITTHFSAMSWQWLAVSSLPAKWIPDSVGRNLGERFVRSTRFFPISTPEVSVKK